MNKLRVLGFPGEAGHQIKTRMREVEHRSQKTPIFESTSKTSRIEIAGKNPDAEFDQARKGEQKHD